MVLVATIVLGGIFGWLASSLMHSHAQHGLPLKFLAALTGGFLVSYFLTAFLSGVPMTSGPFDLRSLLISFAGTVALLALVDFVRRNQAR